MKKLTLCTIFSFCIMALASTALAEKILTVNNKSGYTANIALRYLDHNYGEWITLGWIEVPARSSRKLSVDTNNGVLYYYGRTNDKRYSWAGSYNDRNDKKYWVRDAKMMISGQGRITGKNQRRVWFDHLSSSSDGNFYITLND